MQSFRHQIQSGKVINFLTDFVLAPPPLSSAEEGEEEEEEEDEDALNDVAMLFLVSLLSLMVAVVTPWTKVANLSILSQIFWLQV